MKRGIDISRWQGEVDFANLGVDFIISRAGYGTVEDYMFDRNRNASIGYYWYAYPEYNEPETEAHAFADIVGVLEAGKFVCLDYEANWDGDQVEWCRRFLATISDRLKTTPYIYMDYNRTQSRDWSSLFKYPLWLARWDYNPDSPKPTIWGGNVKLRQYTNKLNINGKLYDGDVMYEEQKVSLTIFSQQDPAWSWYKYKNNFTIGRYGCTITCLAMARNWFYNKTDNPVWTASHLQYTDDGLILWNSLPEAGLKLVERVYGRNEEKINSALKAPDQCVILQVNYNHWVWAIGRKLPYLGYKIADPWTGTVCYTNKYSDNITGCAVITRG